MMGVTRGRGNFAPYASLALAALAVSFFAEPSRAIELIFDYSYDERGFFKDPARRELLEWAGRQYSGQLDGTLGELGSTSFRARFSNPQDGEMISLEDLDVEAQTVVIFVGARPLMEGNRIAVGGPGYAQFPCDIMGGWEVCVEAMGGHGDPSELRKALFEVVFRSSWRSLQFPPSSFAPWGGSLSFGSDVAWYFGDSRNVPSDLFDFLSSAIHELGHVLGIGSAESWSSLVPRQFFEGAQTTALHGGPVPLHTDFGHWAPGTSSWAEGIPQEAAFTPRLAAGERKLLTELDVAALRDIGWTVDEQASSMIEIEQSYVGRRIKGDVNGDGVVNDKDAQLVRAHLDAQAATRDVEMGVAKEDRIQAEGLSESGVLDDPRALAAADVFPMVDGNSIGDGLIDESDVALLRTVATLVDVDGDGLVSADENFLNETVWMNVIGRPRYQPLNRWTEECFEDIPFLSHWRYMSINGWVTFIYCSRDGTPWSTAPGLAPGDLVDEFDAQASAGHFEQPKSSIDSAFPIFNRDTPTTRDTSIHSGVIPPPQTTRTIAPPVSVPPRAAVEINETGLSGLLVAAPVSGSPEIASARPSDLHPSPGSDSLDLANREAVAGAREPDWAMPTALGDRISARPEVAIARPSDLHPLPGSDSLHLADREAVAGAREPNSGMLAALRDWISALLQSLKKCADLVLSRMH